MAPRKGTNPKSREADARFVGGTLGGSIIYVQNTSNPYFFYHRAGAGVEDGKVTKDRYEWDEQKQSMVYIGSTFGHEDERTMRRLTAEQAKTARQMHSKRGTLPRTTRARR